jgi:hypothetical protein
MQDYDGLVPEGLKNCFLRRTSFLAKQSLQTKHTTGNAHGQVATVTSAVFSRTELSVGTRETVAGRLRASSCECNNEPLIQRKVREFSDYLGVCYLIKKEVWIMQVILT